MNTPSLARRLAAEAGGSHGIGAEALQHVAAFVLASCKPQPESQSPGAPAAEATAPSKEADYAKLGYSNGIFTDPDTKQPFTGIARQKDPNGTLRGE